MKKRYIHWGVPVIVIILLMYPLLLAPLVIFQVYASFYIILLITAGLLFGLLCVYNITITIDETYISFKLGIGLIKKRYKIANIESCKPVTGISKRIGVGSKLFFSGDVLKYYIVTGFEAIELRFRDNDRLTVRIGTPLTKEIIQQIQLLLVQHNQ